MIDLEDVFKAEYVYARFDEMSAECLIRVQAV